MRKNLFLGFVITSGLLSAQVGVGTADPKATLDVTGKPTDVNVVDGIIPPRITGDQLRAKSGPYGHAPKS